MMVLRFIQTVEIEPTRQPTELGRVPIVGQTLVTRSRPWFQCDRCGIIACLYELASPMMAPPCPQGCDPEPIT